jgi:hypothetical protein
MFFNTNTVYKAYETERGALNYIARNFSNTNEVPPSSLLDRFT